MTDMRVVLNRGLWEGLMDRCQAVGAPIVDRLRPGLEDDEMDQLTASLGLRLPEELRTWWGWHDGATTAESVLAAEREVAPGLPFMSLGEAIERCEYWRETSRNWHEGSDGDQPDPWWGPSWVPITDAGQAGIIACDCDVPDDGASSIRCVQPPAPGDAIAAPVYASLGGLVCGWIDAFDTGAWRYDHGWRTVSERVPEVERRLFGPSRSHPDDGVA